MTAEEAIEILANEMPCCGEKVVYSEGERCEAYDMAISSLRAQQQPNVPLTGWISVKDRLPEDMGDVLVVTYWHEKWQTLIGWHAKKSGMWHVYAGLEDRNSLMVTHWMPLPEPPEEGTK